MKRSKYVTLVLITSALAACNKTEKAEPNWDSNEVYMRADSTASYTHTQGSYLPLFLWYYAFRPYGMFGANGVRHAGYYSGALSKSSNIGSSATKSRALRGGFGNSRSFKVGA
jgi:hypothetical protein